MPDTSKYTEVDIERYLTERMSSEEMHEFEKAMMEDSFLDDAVDGYRRSKRRNVSNVNKYLDQIELRVMSFLLEIERALDGEAEDAALTIENFKFLHTVVLINNTDWRSMAVFLNAVRGKKDSIRIESVQQIWNEYRGYMQHLNLIVKRKVGSGWEDFSMPPETTDTHVEEKVIPKPK